MHSGFSIGPIYIHFYGILIMLGVLAAAWLSDSRSQTQGRGPGNRVGLCGLAAGGRDLRRPHLAYADPPASMQQGPPNVLPHPSSGCPGDLEGGVWVFLGP